MRRQVRDDDTLVWEDLLTDPDDDVVTLERGPVGREPVRRAAGERAGRSGFWSRYEAARLEAELLTVPPVAVSAVVGDLEHAVAVARRCQAEHWSGCCEVTVLTNRPDLVEDEGWAVLRRTSDLVNLVEGGEVQFPLLVIDVPVEPPAWIRPLVDRLRQAGVGLVRYALAGDPSDEDLATWHGEIGRPAVLDLVTALEPARVLDLVERGEPVATVAGVTMTAQLLFALRAEVRR